MYSANITKPVCETGFRTTYKIKQRNYIIRDARQKPLPPFGKKLEILLANGQRPKNNIFIFMGIKAWQKAKAFENSQYVLALPYGVDPMEYTWPVKECCPLVFNTGGADIAPDMIEKFAYILLVSGATVVHVILFDGRLIIFRNEVRS